MNEKLEALLNEAETLLNEGKLEDAKAKRLEADKLQNEIEEAKKEMANINAMRDNAVSVNPVVASAAKAETWSSPAEMYNSVEYRTAFMNNILGGTPIPSKFMNSDAYTTTGDTAGVIPSTLIQKIVGKLESVGKFYNMVTKTNYKGGVSIPVSNINLSASWVTERSTSDKQKAAMGTSITFTYNKLVCKVAVSFEVDTVTLDIFEAYFVQKVADAMIKAIEQAIFTGSGTNQPKGFLKETPVSGQALKLTADTAIAYADLVACEGALPEEYEAGAIWVMPKKTFFSQIVGMVDANGQPIARVNVGLDGKPEYTILGRKVEFSNYMDAFSTSKAIVAAIFNFSDYALNTNYNMTVKKYIDEDTDDRITKALMLTDGKTVNKNSLVTLSKTA